MKKSNNKFSTLIECSPGKNIIYTVSESEGQLICDLLENWRHIYGKYPKIQDMIDFVKNRPELYGNVLFRDIKIEEKEIPPLKEKTIPKNYVFWEEFSLWDEEYIDKKNKWLHDKIVNGE